MKEKPLFLFTGTGARLDSGYPTWKMVLEDRLERSRGSAGFFPGLQHPGHSVRETVH